MRSLTEIIEDLGDIRWGSAGWIRMARNPTLRRPRIASRRSFSSAVRRDAADMVALQMLEKLLDPDRWRIRMVAPETLTAELLELIAHEDPAFVCIASLAPGGLAHTRYLCKRLSRHFPDLRLIVGRWGEDTVEGRHRQDLEDAGASTTASSLIETRQKLEALLPLLDAGRAERPGPPDPPPALPAQPRRRRPAARDAPCIAPRRESWRPGPPHSKRDPGFLFKVPQLLLLLPWATCSGRFRSSRRAC